MMSDVTSALPPTNWAPKIKPCGYDPGLGRLFRFWCEGCKSNHLINCDGPIRPQWTFNWNPMAPTFGPSYHITTPGKVCHSFIRDGFIQYLGDCDHALKGQTIPLTTLDYPYALWEIKVAERDIPLEQLVTL